MERTELEAKLSMTSGRIEISLSLDGLKQGAERHPDLWNGETDIDVPFVNITDKARFAREIVYKLNSEQGEDGSTLISTMFDNAIISAIEDGCEGVEHT